MYQVYRVLFPRLRLQIKVFWESVSKKCAVLDSRLESVFVCSGRILKISNMFDICRVCNRSTFSPTHNFPSLRLGDVPIGSQTGLRLPQASWD